MANKDEFTENKAFEHYLRTGRTIMPDAVEHKFNPYHDPRNGQFTFAPGGPRSISNALFSDRRGLFRPKMRITDTVSKGTLNDIANLGQPKSTVQVAQYRPVGRRGLGGNSGPSPYDPMTLAQTFPGLASAPAGSIFALADSLLEMTVPSVLMEQDLTPSISRKADRRYYRARSQLSFGRTIGHSIHSRWANATHQPPSLRSCDNLL